MALARQVRLLSLPLVLLALGSSCRSMAVRNAQEFALQYHASLQAAPSRIHDPELEEYLGDLGVRVRTTAQDLARESWLANLPPDEPIPEAMDTELDFYDQFEVYLVHSVAPNAATPGDDCAEITSRLFLEASSAEQIVAVLCHEFGHVEETHTVDRLERQYEMEVAAGIVAAAGAYADAYAGANNPYHVQQDWGQIYLNAIQAYEPWRKEDEFEADLRGLEIYLELGLDPVHFIELFELLARWGDAESSTHPKPSERIENLETALADLGSSQEFESLEASEFSSMQARLAEVLEEQIALGFLVPHEEFLVEALASKELKTKVSACGPIEFDGVAMEASFHEILAGVKSTEAP